MCIQFLIFLFLILYFPVFVLFNIFIYFLLIIYSYLKGNWLHLSLTAMYSLVTKTAGGAWLALDILIQFCSQCSTSFFGSKIICQCEDRNRQRWLVLSYCFPVFERWILSNRFAVTHMICLGCPLQGREVSPWGTQVGDCCLCWRLAEGCQWCLRFTNCMWVSLRGQFFCFCILSCFFKVEWWVCVFQVVWHELLYRPVAPMIVISSSFYVWHSSQSLVKVLYIMMLPFVLSGGWVWADIVLTCAFILLSKCSTLSIIWM